MPKHLVLFHVITSALFIDYEQCMYTVNCTVSFMYYVRTECVLCKYFIMVKYIFLEDSRKHSCSTLDFPIGIHDEIIDK